MMRVPILGSPGPLAESETIDRAVASAPVEVGCLRTIDRIRMIDRLTAA